MVADLLELDQQGQHLALALHLVAGRIDLLQLLAHDGLVERRLLGRQEAVDLALLLLRQVVDHGRIGLDAAQNKGRD